MTKVNPQKKVEEIYKLFQGLEQESKEAQFDSMFLNELKILIEELNEFEDPVLKKLSQYSHHLNANMTLRHFSNLAVPFERYLKKNITDDDFLVSSHDRDHLVTERVPLHFCVDNMRSAFNVGSIFRTADTLGAQKIWLSGYTPTPHQIQVDRASMGAAFILEWEAKPFNECIDFFKKNHFQTIALETSAKAIDISLDFDFQNPTVFIIGNERFGLDHDQLKMCDSIRKIPTYGIKNSLNAGVAAAIAGYEWRKQYNELKTKV